MKKLLFIPVAFLLGLFIVSCEDSTTGPDNTPTTGNLSIQSTPTGAQIWYVKGTTGTPTNSGKTTPDTLKNLDAAQYTILLKLDGYRDTTYVVTITAGQTLANSITLKRAALTFGPVRIWETAGTDTTQPSGLDLSTGNAYGIGSASSNRDKVDIYYSSNGFVVRSANAASGLTRVTSFFVGSGSNLNDGVGSPLATSSWASQMGDRETNYVFLFDHDSHYSKLKITNWGGGTPGNPAWVEVTYIYNEQANSRVF